MKDDLISRQAAIDGFYEMASDIDHLCTVSDYVSFLESLSAQPDWIPCSERPPEEVGLYLVTLDYKEHGKCVTALWYHGKQIGWDLRVADVVVAWMPLPTPWEGGQDG